MVSFGPPPPSKKKSKKKKVILKGTLYFMFPILLLQCLPFLETVLVRWSFMKQAKSNNTSTFQTKKDKKGHKNLYLKIPAR